MSDQRNKVYKDALSSAKKDRGKIAPISLIGAKGYCHMGKKCMRKCGMMGKPGSYHADPVAVAGGVTVGDCHEGECWPKD